MLTKIFKVILPQCKKLDKNTQIIQLPQCIFHLVEVSKNEKNQDNGQAFHLLISM